MLGTTQSLASLGMTATTNPVTNPLQGVVFSSQNVGDDLGYAVASAGDFNSDGVDDVLLAARVQRVNRLRLRGLRPEGDDHDHADPDQRHLQRHPHRRDRRPDLDIIHRPGSRGRDRLLARPDGPHSIRDLDGRAAIQRHPDRVRPALGGGEAYLVPGTAAGTTALAIPQMLLNINTTLLGQLFNAMGTSDPAIVNNGFGTSVSARNPVFDAATSSTSLDGDTVPDLFFGAPLSGLNNSTLGTNSFGSNGVRVNSGVAYAIEGALIGGTSSGTTPVTPTTPTTSSGIVTPLAATTLAPPIFTGDLQGLPYPPVSALSHLISYQPLPVQLAYEQFLPAPASSPERRSTTTRARPGGPTRLRPGPS